MGTFWAGLDMELPFDLEDDFLFAKHILSDKSHQRKIKV